MLGIKGTASIWALLNAELTAVRLSDCSQGTELRIKNLERDGRHGKRSDFRLVLPETYAEMNMGKKVNVLFKREDGDGARASEVFLTKRGPNPGRPILLRFSNDRVDQVIELGVKYVLAWHIRGPVGASIKMTHQVISKESGEGVLGPLQTTIKESKIPNGKNIFKRKIASGFIFSSGKRMTFREV